MTSSKSSGKDSHFPDLRSSCDKARILSVQPVRAKASERVCDRSDTVFVSPRRWATNTSDVSAGSWGDVALRLEGTGMLIGFWEELVVDMSLNWMRVSLAIVQY